MVSFFMAHPLDLEKICWYAIQLENLFHQIEVKYNDGCISMMKTVCLFCAGISLHLSSPEEFFREKETKIIAVKSCQIGLLVLSL